MQLIRVIPAWGWLMIGYAVIGAALFWSVHQSINNVSGTVFFLALLTSWLPAYIFANRRDISLNKMFWISQSAGLLAVLLVVFLISPWLSQWQDSAQAEALKERSWSSTFGALGITLLVSMMGNSLLRKTFLKTEAAVEKHLASTESKPSSKAE